MKTVNTWSPAVHGKKFVSSASHHSPTQREPAGFSGAFLQPLSGVLNEDVTASSPQYAIEQRRCSSFEMASGCKETGSMCCSLGSTFTSTVNRWPRFWRLLLPQDIMQASIRKSILGPLSIQGKRIGESAAFMVILDGLYCWVLDMDDHRSGRTADWPDCQHADCHRCTDCH